MTRELTLTRTEGEYLVDLLETQGCGQANSLADDVREICGMKPADRSCGTCRHYAPDDGMCLIPLVIGDLRVLRHAPDRSGPVWIGEKIGCGPDGLWHAMRPSVGINRHCPAPEER